jgi:hypothetical protein
MKDSGQHMQKAPRPEASHYVSLQVYDDTLRLHQLLHTSAWRY